MRAVVCKELGPPEQLTVEELDPPQVASGQVVIEVKAAGVNFPDVLIIEGKYQFQPELPFSPGGEIAGVVKELGHGVSDLAVGDHVIASFPWGGYAEQVVTDASRVLRIAPDIDFDVAAGFMQVYGTSYYALKDRAQLREGETLAVLGAAGGVGLAAVELGKLLGARVIACASTDDKLALCRQYGADETINYSNEDLKSRLKALTGGAGADVIYDPVGGAYSEAALRATAWEGRFLVVGFAAGPIPKLPLNLVLLKSCQVVGVFWGSHTVREREQHLDNMGQLLLWLSEGQLKPHVCARYGFDEAARALRDITERKAVGKVVLVP